MASISMPTLTWAGGWDGRIIPAFGASQDEVMVRIDGSHDHKG